MSRWVRCVLASVLLVLAASGATPVLRISEASACSCAIASVAERLAYADVVVRGVITKVDEPRRVVSSADPMYYTVELSHIWLGEPRNPVVVTTSSDEASCGLPSLRSGQDVLMAGTRLDDSRIEINLCGASGLATTEHIAAVTAALGDGAVAGPPESVPSEPASGPPELLPTKRITVPVAIGAITLVLAVGGTVVWRRRRRGSEPGS